MVELFEPDEFTSVNPLIQMKGGGGGGGGTGAVSWPNYMQVIHGQWLDNAGVDTPTKSMTDLLNEAFATNPYFGIAFYDASADIAAWETELAAFKAAAVALDHDANWLASLQYAKQHIDAELVDTTTVDNAVNEFATLLDNDLAAKVYPAFEAGMRDIGAVNSSAYALGKALIIDNRDARLTAYDAELRHKYHLQRNEMINQMTKFLEELRQRDVEYLKAVASITIEAKRIKIIAKREGVEQDLKISEIEATWEFEAYQYASNLIAGIGGGTSQPGTKNMSQTRSAIGGAMAGASMGIQMGKASGGSASTWGAAGAVVGGVAGYYGAG